jgi:methionyl aminopeptidase
MGLNNNYIKSPSEIAIMRDGGQILASILSEIKDNITVATETWSLEELFLSLCAKYKVIPTCKGYNPYKTIPYPTGLCISINNESVHCYPKKGELLKSGDIVTVDATIKYQGYHLDSSFAVGIGIISKTDKLFLDTCESTLYKAIDLVTNDVKLGKISSTILKGAKSKGFDVLRDYAGHGIGKEMHEWPQILCYGSKNDGSKLKTGMTICIESLFCTKKPDVINTNLWETKMQEGKFCQLEHTVLVLDDGHEILTQVRSKGH